MENIWKIGFLGLLVIAGTGLVMAQFGPGYLQDLEPEQQALLTQMQEARAAGDTEKAQELRTQLTEELGIEGGFRGMRGHRNFQAHGKMLEPEQHEALQEAVANNDWETYSSLVQEYGFEGIPSQITEETFPILVEMQEKREELQTLQTQLAEELGIEIGQGRGCKLGGFGFPGGAGGA